MLPYAHAGARTRLSWANALQAIAVSVVPYGW